MTFSVHGTPKLAVSLLVCILCITVQAFVGPSGFGRASFIANREVLSGRQKDVTLRADTRQHSSRTATKSRIPKSRARSTEKKRQRQVLESRSQPLKTHTLFDRCPCLVLNADYQPLSYLPLSLWNWQEAIKSVFLGKVTVVDVYPDHMVRAANCEFPLPSVIALHEYVPPSRLPDRPSFTRRNVLLRDGFRCQYCRRRFHARDLSLDHVHPRSMGGRLTWENTVASCTQCNGKKGCTPVSELRNIGMSLHRKPVAPTKYDLLKSASRMTLPKDVHSTWKPYLHLMADRDNEYAKFDDEIYKL